MQKFEDVKISCTAISADCEDLSQDFTHAIDTIDTLISHLATPQVARQSFHMKSALDKKLKLKFRHALFEVTALAFTLVFD